MLSSLLLFFEKQQSVPKMIIKALSLLVLVALGVSGYSPVYPAYNSYVGVAPIYSSPVVKDYGYGYASDYGKDYYAYPKYKYNYGVSDPSTGDHKSQAEERDGDVVRGYYTVADPDGTIRTVHYTADDHNGFNAVVEKTGHAIHPAPVVPKTVIYEKPIYGYGNSYELASGGYNPGYKYY